MDVLQHLRIDGFAFGFDVSDLATDHSVDGPGSSGHFGKNGSSAFRRDRGGADRFECQGEECITGENGDGFAKFSVASRLAAAQIVIVESGQIIVDQRVCVDEFDGTGRMKDGCDIAREYSGGL